MVQVVSKQQQKPPLAKAKSNASRLFISLFLLNLLFIFGLYQLRPSQQITVGVAGDDQYIERFYKPETNEQGSYRWTRDGSTVKLPVVGVPFSIEIQAVAYRPPDAPAPAIRLVWNVPVTQKSFAVSQQDAQLAKPFTLSLESSAAPLVTTASGGTLTIYSNTFQPSKTDDRQLGILARQISIKAHPNKLGFITPPVLLWFSGSFGLLAIQSALAFGLLRLKREWRTLRDWRLWLVVLLPLLAVGVAAWQAQAFLLENGLVISLAIAAPAGWLLCGYWLKRRLAVWLEISLIALVLGLQVNMLIFGEMAVLSLGLAGYCLFLFLKGLPKPGAKAVAEFAIPTTTATLDEIAPQADPANKRTVTYWLAKGWVWVIISLIVGLALRLYKLDAFGFWLDETGQYYYASQPLDKLLADYLPDHNPLSYLPDLALLAIFPWRDEFFMRFSSAVIPGLVTIPFCYLLAKELSGRRVAIITVVLTSFWPILVAYSQEYAIYSLFVLLSVCSGYFLLLALNKQVKLAWFGFVVCTILNLYSHYNALFPVTATGLYAALFLIGQLIFVSKQTQSWRAGWQAVRWRLLFSFTSFCLIALAYIPGYFYLMEFLNSPSYGLNRSLPDLSFDLATLAKVWGNLGLGQDLMLATIFVVALVGVGYLAQHRPASATFCILWLALPFLVLLFVRGGAAILMSARYLIFLVPVYMVLVALGVTVVADGLARWLVALKISSEQSLRFGFTAGLVALLIWQSLPYLQGYYTEPFTKINSDIRGAFNFVKADLRSGDVVIGLAEAGEGAAESWWFKYYYRYFLRDAPPGVTAIVLDGKFPAEALNAQGRLWTIVTNWGDYKQLQAMAGSNAKTACYLGICASLQADTTTNMTAKLERFFQSYRPLNPPIMEHTLRLLKQAATLNP